MVVMKTTIVQDVGVEKIYTSYAYIVSFQPFLYSLFTY
jgi:hypothetical protein